MRRPPGTVAALAASATLAALLAGATTMDAQDWDVHSMERPRPPVVTPAPAGPPAPPPSDAIILFDGTGLDAWQRQGGGGPGWRLGDGHVEVVGGAGGLETRQAFGDIQLHLEWAAPRAASGQGQDRGNSGVFLMGLYEIQVLDSWRNDTYPDGQAAALYGQEPPLVNASHPPGEWQTFDIVFRAPRFREDGSLAAPARVTVLHNGVLVHDAVAFHGRTVHGARARYTSHPDRLPLALQDHGDPVRFRNIWLRELSDDAPR